jgi:hypothetical protein
MKRDKTVQEEDVATFRDSSFRVSAVGRPGNSTGSEVKPKVPNLNRV